jgi:hypothetical protein
MQATAEKQETARTTPRGQGNAQKSIKRQTNQ